MTRLGQHLIKKGILTEDQLEKSFRAQLVFGGRIGTTLIELGFITERTLGEALAEVLAVPYAAFERLQDIPAEVIGLVPPNLAASYKVIPFRVEEKTLHLAMMNPTDLLVQDEVSFLTEMRVSPWVAPEIRILEALDRYYKVPRERRFIALTGELNLLVLRERQAARPKPERVAAPPSRGGEAGLDGRPIHESPEPPGAHPSPERSGPAPRGREIPPRSLEEWRDGRPAEPAFAHNPASAQKPLPPAAPSRPPESLPEAAERLAQAETRDEVAQVILRFAGQVVRRTGLFILQKQQVLAWHWSSSGGSGNGFRGITVSLDTPSLFSPFRTLKTPYLGPITALPANRDFFARLGGEVPRSAVILPILIQGKVAVLLYGDNGREGIERVDLSALQRIARKASAALEVLILKNKIRSL